MEPSNYSMMAEEKEINLIDLIWKVLRSWRFILCLCLIFCVATAGYKYLSDYRSIENEKKMQQRPQEEQEEELTNEELQAVNAVLVVLNQIQEKQAYQKNSVVMNIDAYNKNIATLYYYVDTDYKIDLTKEFVPDYAAQLINSYAAYIRNNGFYKEVKNSLDWDIEQIYFNELISIKSDAISTNNNTFSISITAESGEKCEELAQAVGNAVEAYQKNLADKIGEHELKRIDTYQGVVSDTELADRQDSLDTRIVDLRNQVTNLKTNMSDTQIKYLENIESEIIDEEDSKKEQESASLSVKYLLLGFVLGGFLGCMWIGARYVFDRSVKSADELQTIYGIRVFGKLYTAEMPKKRAFGFVDRWIDLLQKKESWTNQELLELIETNLRVTCEKQKVDRVLLTTALHLDESDRKWAEEIMKSLKKASVDVVFGENMLRNAKTFEQMAEIGNVVLLEKAGATEYAAFEKELQFCKEQKANILGSVVLEQNA